MIESGESLHELVIEEMRSRWTSPDSSPLEIHLNSTHVKIQIRGEMFQIRTQNLESDISRLRDLLSLCTLSP